MLNLLISENLSYSGGEVIDETSFSVVSVVVLRGKTPIPLPFRRELVAD